MKCRKKTYVVNPYENQYKEKDTIIENLNKKIESNERESCDVLAKLKVEHDIQMRELQTEIQRLRTEKINLEIDNEHLNFSLKCTEDTNTKLKTLYDERLNDKDKIIQNLQDRIQKLCI